MDFQINRGGQNWMILEGPLDLVTLLLRGRGGLLIRGRHYLETQNPALKQSVCWRWCGITTEMFHPQTWIDPQDMSAERGTLDKASLNSLNSVANPTAEIRVCWCSLAILRGCRFGCGMVGWPFCAARIIFCNGMNYAVRIRKTFRNLLFIVTLQFTSLLTWFFSISLKLFFFCLILQLAILHGKFQGFSTNDWVLTLLQVSQCIVSAMQLPL